MTLGAVLSGQPILGLIPNELRRELLAAYERIVQNYRERRWEPSELNGGKFCEVVYTILRGYVDGSFPTTAAKPSNIVDACRAFERAPSATFPRSVRIQIPRMLIALYEIRNNRGVGHVGGDVDPNQMDATCVLQMSKWVMAELVRLFHSIDTDAASSAVDAIVQRILPIVWDVDGTLRVMDTSLKMKEKTLVLLYHHHPQAVAEGDLFEWVEYSRPSSYRINVLQPLHKERLIEYDAKRRIAIISPKGIEYVEDCILGTDT
jgi:hypothetical protein